MFWGEVGGVHPSSTVPLFLCQNMKRFESATAATAVAKTHENDQNGEGQMQKNKHGVHVSTLESSVTRVAAIAEIRVVAHDKYVLAAPILPTRSKHLFNGPR